MTQNWCVGGEKKLLSNHFHFYEIRCQKNPVGTCGPGSGKQTLRLQHYPITRVPSVKKVKYCLQLCKV